MPLLPAPFIAELRVVRSRLSEKWDSLDINTSDELAHELVLTRMDWSIVPLSWHLPDGAAPLLDHVVTGIGAAFEGKTKPPRASVEAADDVWDQLSSKSPLEAGGRATQVFRLDAQVLRFLNSSLLPARQVRRLRSSQIWMQMQSTTSTASSLGSRSIC